MDNQFAAPNDSAIDYQLRLRGRLIAGADPRSLADVLNSVGKRIASQDLVLGRIDTRESPRKRYGRRLIALVSLLSSQALVIHTVLIAL